MDFLTEHWDTLTTIVGILMAVASLVTGLTDTPKDDSVLAKVRSFLALVGLLQPKDSPGTVKAPLTKPSSPSGDKSPSEPQERPESPFRFD